MELNGIDLDPHLIQNQRVVPISQYSFSYGSLFLEFKLNIKEKMKMIFALL